MVAPLRFYNISGRAVRPRGAYMTAAAWYHPYAGKFLFLQSSAMVIKF